MTPDRTAGIVTRKLDDGREFRIVKVFHEPAPLAASLAALGFTARIGKTPRYFIYGDVRATG
jgi:demethylmenaquinone methyltransferase/2-methoxy-6-polyprenyl-1,4-benzoquinol methylase